MTDPFTDRITELNDAPVRGGNFVLYWMQQAQRTRYNHALEYAVRLANELRLPLVVGFGLTADYPDAAARAADVKQPNPRRLPQVAARHYRFMLEGLAELGAALERRNIRFVLRLGDPSAVALDLGRDAAAIVCDRGYLRHQREWRYRVGRHAGFRVVEVESELIVPVERASIKQEYAARTVRPKIHRLLGDYLVPLPEESVTVTGRANDLPRGEDPSEPTRLLGKLDVPDDPGPVSRFFRGGQTEAARRLETFRTELLPDYEEQRNEPSLDVSSKLSPYLHFGQISPLEIALALDASAFVAGLETGAGRMKNQPGSVGMRVADERTACARDAFLEELLVRRGLAHNYVWYARDYDRYQGLPAWARQTLTEHAGDERPAIYTMDQLVAAETHDPHWNDAMREMVVTGYMHNYMRMYWAKKILEWTPSPAEAFATTLELNNRYFLDGRDPNSYANVAWVFGLHDRPWTERAVFGKVRYMNANGLRRKFDMDAYALKVRKLADEAQGS